MNYYGTDADYIHLKFGDMRKAYNFTKKFRESHPNFCAEYAKYWNGDETCKFKTPLQIVQYIDMYKVPVNLYFNYTDRPVKNLTEVYEYFLWEYTGKTGLSGLDGETAESTRYKVTEA